MLDVSPAAFPIRVWRHVAPILTPWSPFSRGEDNIIAALKHNDRICDVELERVPGLVLKRFAAAMQESFPGLTHLSLWSSDETSNDETVPVLPETFLV